MVKVIYSMYPFFPPSFLASFSFFSTGRKPGALYRWDTPPSLYLFIFFYFVNYISKLPRPALYLGSSCLSFNEQLGLQTCTTMAFTSTSLHGRLKLLIICVQRHNYSPGTCRVLWMKKNETEDGSISFLEAHSQGTSCNENISHTELSYADNILSHVLR